MVEGVLYFVLSLQGRGSEVLFLPGDSDAAAGDIDKAISNRKTVSELLSLDPHDTDVFSVSQICSMCNYYAIVLKFSLHCVLGRMFYL